MDIGASIQSQTDFSLGLTKEILEVSGDKNVVFSPLSISVALSLAAGGAKGPTLNQFCSCLRFKDAHQLHELSSRLINEVLRDGSANGGPLLSFVNGVWVDQSMTLKPSYRDVVKNQYNTEAISVDFINKANEITMEVNKWAADATNRKIEELISADSVDENTRLVLANALYFKGTWQKKFDSSATKEAAFNLLDGTSVQVPMMTTAKKQFIKKGDDCKILRIPYAQGQDNRSFSMYFILPDDINGLPELERKVNPNFLELHLSRVSKVKVGSFQLPRFKISFGVEVTEMLKRVGLVLPFSKEANFTEMVDSLERLYISNVSHKSFVEVNEEGTEAAAATAVTFRLLCAKLYPIEDFIADHPFMFVIKEEHTGVILFVGRVLNPLNS